MLITCAMSHPIVRSSPHAVPLYLLTMRRFPAWQKAQPARVQRWLRSTGFTAKQGAYALLPSEDGELGGVVCVAESVGVYTLAHLPMVVPEGVYALVAPVTPDQAGALALGWWLGSYRFSRYKKPARLPARLVAPKGVALSEVIALAESTTFARDLINTPANDMLPDALAAEAVAVAKTCGARVSITEGAQLLKANYPLIYAVGKASSVAPRLVDMVWGNPAHPKVTLVGKGVCFDSGGLDLKPSGNMRLMKKDMGGAAVALGLARMVMSQRLPVRLRVLLPLVENAVAGNAMRPLDVVLSRKGLSVEIGNTDAEGRLILCDALSEADRESPDLLVDFATLTGAARVALGTDLPALFTADDALASALQRAGAAVEDPLYRLPLHAPYRTQLDSRVADLNNDPDSSYGGAISAALFLSEFVERAAHWAHVDLMAWNVKDSPGRPQGAEAQTLRTFYRFIKERYV